MPSRTRLLGSGLPGARRVRRQVDVALVQADQQALGSAVLPLQAVASAVQDGDQCFASTGVSAAAYAHLIAAAHTAVSAAVLALTASSALSPEGQTCQASAALQGQGSVSLMQDHHTVFAT